MPSRGFRCNYRPLEACLKNSGGFGETKMHVDSVCRCVHVWVRSCVVARHHRWNLTWSLTRPQKQLSLRVLTLTLNATVLIWNYLKIKQAKDHSQHLVSCPHYFIFDHWNKLNMNYKTISAMLRISSRYSGCDQRVSPGIILHNIVVTSATVLVYPYIY